MLRYLPKSTKRFNNMFKSEIQTRLIHQFGYPREYTDTILDKITRLEEADPNVRIHRDFKTDIVKWTSSMAESTGDSKYQGLSNKLKSNRHMNWANLYLVPDKGWRSMVFTVENATDSDIRDILGTVDDFKELHKKCMDFFKEFVKLSFPESVIMNRFINALRRELQKEMNPITMGELALTCVLQLRKFLEGSGSVRTQPINQLYQVLIPSYIVMSRSWLKLIEATISRSNLSMFRKKSFGRDTNNPGKELLDSVKKYLAESGYSMSFESDTHSIVVTSFYKKSIRTPVAEEKRRQLEDLANDMQTFFTRRCSLSGTKKDKQEITKEYPVCMRQVGWNKLLVDNNDVEEEDPFADDAQEQQDGEMPYTEVLPQKRKSQTTSYPTPKPAAKRRRKNNDKDVSTADTTSSSTTVASRYTVFYYDKLPLKDLAMCLLSDGPRGLYTFEKFNYEEFVKKDEQSLNKCLVVYKNLTNSDERGLNAEHVTDLGDILKKTDEPFFMLGIAEKTLQPQQADDNLNELMAKRLSTEQASVILLEGLLEGKDDAGTFYSDEPYTLPNELVKYCNNEDLLTQAMILGMGDGEQQQPEQPSTSTTTDETTGDDSSQSNEAVIVNVIPLDAAPQGMTPIELNDETYNWLLSNATVPQQQSSNENVDDSTSKYIRDALDTLLKNEGDVPDEDFTELFNDDNTQEEATLMDDILDMASSQDELMDTQPAVVPQTVTMDNIIDMATQRPTSISEEEAEIMAANTQPAIPTTVQSVMDAPDTMPDADLPSEQQSADGEEEQEIMATLTKEKVIDRSYLNNLIASIQPGVPLSSFGSEETQRATDSLLSLCDDDDKEDTTQADDTPVDDTQADDTPVDDTTQADDTQADDTNNDDDVDSQATELYVPAPEEVVPDVDDQTPPEVVPDADNDQTADIFQKIDSLAMQLDNTTQDDDDSQVTVLPDSQATVLPESQEEEEMADDDEVSTTDVNTDVSTTDVNTDTNDDETLLDESQSILEEPTKEVYEADTAVLDEGATIQMPEKEWDGDTAVLDEATIQMPADEEVSISDEPPTDNMYIIDHDDDSQAIVTPDTSNDESSESDTETDDQVSTDQETEATDDQVPDTSDLTTTEETTDDQVPSTADDQLTPEPESTEENSSDAVPTTTTDNDDDVQIIEPPPSPVIDPIPILHFLKSRPLSLNLKMNKKRKRSMDDNEDDDDELYIIPSPPSPNDSDDDCIIVSYSPAPSYQEPPRKKTRRNLAHYMDDDDGFLPEINESLMKEEPQPLIVEGTIENVLVSTELSDQITSIVLKVL